MALHMKVNGLIIKLTALEHIYGKMDANIMVNGQIMTCRVVEYTFMLMVLGMMDNILMIKKKVMVSITGQMVENMKAGGTKESSMV